MNEELKALLKKYKAILAGSNKDFIAEFQEIVINNILETHTISLKPIEKCQN